MPRDTSLQPRYVDSHALVIGIDNYSVASPLSYARSDAEAVANTLEARYGFPSRNVHRLLDRDATRHTILEQFLAFRTASSRDDRIVVFFAGHGYTERGARGEVGFLVPADGDAGRLASLIRWDDFTRNAELIPAKHILFLMDACYGGLMLTRALPSGSARFLRDTLQRYSRQVLTAGKADELVADSGGPRPEHSIFTGYLLNALEGDAPARDGILTANSVMSYVFENVSRDVHSRQTPHYGFFDGDGEFIFIAPDLDESPPDDEDSVDPLIQLPPTTNGGATPTTEQTLGSNVKEFLSDPRSLVRLDSVVIDELRIAARAIEQVSRAFDEPANGETFVRRLQDYEQAVAGTLIATIALGRWADEAQQSVLARVPARIADQVAMASGFEVWLDLRWYPLYRLIYAGGIAAVSGANYSSLRTLFTTEVGDRRMSREAGPAGLVATDAVTELHDWFKKIPGQERHLVPISEYLFKGLQPQIEDTLFLGGSYEQQFDRFEVFRALIVADLNERERDNSWAPDGRFSWKQRRSRGPAPFDVVVNEASREGNNWPPLKAGLFEGSSNRFDEVAKRYRTEILNRFRQW